VNRVVQLIAGWFGYSGGALGERQGVQYAVPGARLSQDVDIVSADTALQIDTIWACADRRGSIIASLPFFAYDVPANGGVKTLATTTRLYQLLHDSPNSRMTPFDFWRTMMLNLDLRGNAYARIQRAAPARGEAVGEAVALWPMPADQVEQFIAPDGGVFYLYSLFDQTFIYAEDDVLHLKGLGNGIKGLAKLEFMAPSISEANRQTSSALKTFGNQGKPSALLMTDKVLTKPQRDALLDRFDEMASGNESRLFVLEADLKYQQINATAEEIQLLDSRKFSTEQLCRFMDCPPVLVYHSNQTAWGSGIEQIIEGFHKFTIGPLAVMINQAVRKRVMTPVQRSRMSCELSLDALLRGSPKARFELYQSAKQNGIMTSDECRGLENLPAMGGNAAVLTVQSSLVPLNLLGKTPPGAQTPSAPIKQSEEPALVH
jgi:HK97 family phage portal protein